MFTTDPIYLVLMLLGAGLTFLPQWWVMRTFRAYSDVPTVSALTGAQLAQRLLQEEGIQDVTVEPTPGELSDHYDPSAKAVRLSSANYYGHSVAGVAVAAHEVGHAIQHARGYYPVVLRSALAPVVNLGSQLGPMLFFVSLAIGVGSQAMPGWAFGLAWLGVALFGLAVVFHMVTLPVEFNASRRALAILESGRYLSVNEIPGAKKVLFAAALTYVAAALYAAIQLVYFIMRLVGMQQQQREE